jgi:hypothetical protein
MYCPLKKNSSYASGVVVVAAVNPSPCAATAIVDPSPSQDRSISTSYILVKLVEI